MPGIRLLVSGINLYAMAILLHTFLGWTFGLRVIVATSLVPAYVLLGDSTVTIYTDVVQFLLIVAALSPLIYFVLRDFHGLDHLEQTLSTHLRHPLQNFHSFIRRTLRRTFAKSFRPRIYAELRLLAYRFLLMQRGLAAPDGTATCHTPLIAALPSCSFAP